MKELVGFFLDFATTFLVVAIVIYVIAFVIWLFRGE